MLERLVLLPNNKAITFDSTYDYTIVMTWLKWTGRTTPEHIIAWQASIEKAEKDGLKIRDLYLNLYYMGFESDTFK